MSLSVLAETVLPSEMPCTFEYRDQKFYITDPALGFARAMSADTMLASFENAAKAILIYHSGQCDQPASAEIIPFRRAG